MGKASGRKRLRSEVGKAISISPKLGVRGIGAVVLLLILIFGLGAASFKKNFVWKDELTLWEDVVKKNPDKERGHNNLGIAYYELGRMDEAIKEYQQAIKLK